jgi:peptidoglycan-N-acetylglucosamine deacetylase
MASAVVAVLVVIAAAAAVWSCAPTSEPDTSTASTTREATSSTSGVASTAVPPSSSTLTTATATAGSSAVPAPIVRTGPKDRKWIALTFDDNYQGSNATKTIAVLKDHDVPATFFVIGHYVDLGPKLAKEIATAGFEVGDHTRSHANCAELSARALRIEIGNGTDHFRAVTGAPTVALFRPPGGYVDKETCQIAAEKGFKYVVMWDIDTNDWRGRTAAQITETVMGNAHNGAIVLMHMAAKHTAEALPGIITRLRDAGYELVPLSKMLSL